MIGIAAIALVAPLLCWPAVSNYNAIPFSADPLLNLGMALPITIDSAMKEVGMITRNIEAILNPYLCDALRICSPINTQDRLGILKNAPSADVNNFAARVASQDIKAQVDALKTILRNAKKGKYSGSEMEKGRLESIISDIRDAVNICVHTSYTRYRQMIDLLQKAFEENDGQDLMTASLSGM